MTSAQPDFAKEASAGSRLPYAFHVDDRTIETRDGLLMQVIRLGGLMFETADTDELNYRKALHHPHRAPRQPWRKRCRTIGPDGKASR